MTKHNKNKQLLIAKLIECGWARDAHGHYKKEMTFKTSEGLALRLVRCKMQATSFRFERRVICVGSHWVKMRHGYFKNIIPTEDGRLNCGGFILGKKRPIVPVPEAIVGPNVTLTSFLKLF
jgi:hypothetical protein